MKREKTITSPEASPNGLDLASFLPYRLSVLSNTVSRRIADHYERAFALALPQWRVMAVVAQSPGLTATAVGEQTAMDKVAVSRAVTGLIKDGRLTRRASVSDGRTSALHLTAAGRRIYEAVAPDAMAFEQRLLGHITPEERVVFLDLLRRLEVAAETDGPPQVKAETPPS